MPAKKKRALIVEIDSELKDEFVQHLQPGETITAVVEQMLRDYVQDAKARGVLRMVHPSDRCEISFTLLQPTAGRDEAAAAFFRVTGDKQSFGVRYSVSGTCAALLHIAGLGRGRKISQRLLRYYERHLEEHFEELARDAKSESNREQGVVEVMLSSQDAEAIKSFFASNPSSSASD